MIFKPGTKIDGTKPRMIAAWAIVDEVYILFTGKEATLTSGFDGNHKGSPERPSLHYEGLADDFRTRDVAENLLPQIVNQIKHKLQLISPYYQVVLESTHLHIEFDQPG